MLRSTSAAGIVPNDGLGVPHQHDHALNSAAPLHQDFRHVDAPPLVGLGGSRCPPHRRSLGLKLQVGRDPSDGAPASGANSAAYSPAAAPQTAGTPRGSGSPSRGVPPSAPGVAAATAHHAGPPADTGAASCQALVAFCSLARSSPTHGLSRVCSCSTRASFRLRCGSATV